MSSDTKNELSEEVYLKYKKDIEQINKDVSTTIQVDARKLGQKFLNDHAEVFTKELIKDSFESLDMKNIVKDEIGSNIANLNDEIKNLDTEVTEVKRHVTGLAQAFERMQEEKKRSENIFKGFNDKLEIFFKPLIFVFAIGLLFGILFNTVDMSLGWGEWLYPTANELLHTDGIFKSVLGLLLYIAPMGLLGVLISLAIKLKWMN